MSQFKIANPATTYCINQGYKWEMRESPEGQIGYCIFPEPYPFGSICDEWKYFNGECKPGQVKLIDTSRIMFNPYEFLWPRQGKLTTRNFSKINTNN